MMQRRAKIRTAGAAARVEAATVSQRLRIMDFAAAAKNRKLAIDLSASGAAFDPRIFGSANSKANYVRSLVGAFGINRPSGDRAAPYWRHVMVIDLYLAMADGVWIYEPEEHSLLPHLTDDIRGQTDHQDFVATAPLNLIYVAHGERMTDMSREGRRRSVSCRRLARIGKSRAELLSSV